MLNLLYVGAAVLVFVAVLLFGQFVYWNAQSRREEEAKELSRRLGTVADRTLTPLLRFQRNEREGMAAALDEMIRRAGSPYTVETLYTRMAVAGAVGAVIGLALTKSPLGLILAGAAYLPVISLRSEAEKRARRITEQLPEGLDLICRSLQAGHGISEAIRLVAEEMDLPLAQEFGRVYEENNLGRDFRECMENLNARNPGNFDLQIFVSSVLLQRDTGGNLVEILQSIAGTIRSRFVFEGKLRALTSEATFTGYVLGGLPFFTILVLAFMAPQYLTPLATDNLGHLFIVYAVVSFGLGVFFMSEVAKVEV